MVIKKSEELILKSKIRGAEFLHRMYGQDYEDGTVKIKFHHFSENGSAGKIYDKKDKLWRWEFETSFLTDTVIIQDRTERRRRKK
jgi:hypothetical protein